MNPTPGQQPHISIYKVRRSADHKLIALISKVLLDDGNRILSPRGIFLSRNQLFHGIFLWAEWQATPDSSDGTQLPEVTHVQGWLAESLSNVMFLITCQL